MAAGDILSAEVLGAAPDTYSGYIAGSLIQIKYAGMAAGGTSRFDTPNVGFNANGNIWKGLSDETTAYGRLTVTSKGFDASGTATTITRHVYLMRDYRQKNPNEAAACETVSGSDLLKTYVLSEPVYAKDKSGAGNSGVDITLDMLSGVYTKSGTPNNATTAFAVTNFSSLAYRKPKMRWEFPNRQRFTSTHNVGVHAAHLFGVACVKVTETDAHSNAVMSTVGSRTKRLRPVTGLYYESWVASINPSALTQGDAVTVNAKVYPLVGDVYFDSSTDGVTPEAARNKDDTYYCDCSGGLAVYAVVSAAGTSGGTNSTNVAMARADPWDTIAHAQAGTPAPTVIYINATSGTFTVTGVPLTADVGYWRELAKDPTAGVGAVTVHFPSETQSTTPRWKVSGITYDLTANFQGFYGNESNYVWWDKVNFVCNGYSDGSTDGDLIANYLATYITDCVFDDASKWGLKMSGGDSNNVLADGILLNSSVTVLAKGLYWTAFACKTQHQCWTDEIGKTAQVNQFFGGNVHYLVDNIHQYEAAVDLSIVYENNVLEASNSLGVTAILTVGAFGNILSAKDNQINHNTFVGGRFNSFYNQAANAPVTQENRFSNNCVHRFNVIGDSDTSHWSAGDGFNNHWDTFGVSYHHNIAHDWGGDGSDYKGPEYVEYGDAPMYLFGFVHDASSNVSGGGFVATGDGTGNGDYSYASSSSAPVGKGSRPTMAFDIAGNAIPVTGGNLGAYGGQSFGPSITASIPTSGTLGLAAPIPWSTNDTSGAFTLTANGTGGTWSNNATAGIAETATAGTLTFTPTTAAATILSLNGTNSSESFTGASGTITTGASNITFAESATQTFAGTAIMVSYTTSTLSPGSLTVTAAGASFTPAMPLTLTGSTGTLSVVYNSSGSHTMVFGGTGPGYTFTTINGTLSLTVIPLITILSVTASTTSGIDIVFSAPVTLADLNLSKFTIGGIYASIGDCVQVNATTISLINIDQWVSDLTGSTLNVANSAGDAIAFTSGALRPAANLALGIPYSAAYSTDDFPLRMLALAAL